MKKALVVLSGGQDSTTCLYWAKTMFDEVHALSFDYGQRHAAELEAAKKIAELAGVVEHRIVDLKSFGQLSESALTRKDIAVAHGGGLGGLPSTFTPGRNIVFLANAASYGATRGIVDLVTGVCQTDFSGYPDCRRETIDSLEQTLQYAGVPVRIHTPLMFLTKAESVTLARRLPGCWDALKYSLTCYNGIAGGCMTCPACELRIRGFADAELEDPARANDPRA